MTKVASLPIRTHKNLPPLPKNLRKAGKTYAPKPLTLDDLIPMAKNLSDDWGDDIDGVDVEHEPDMSCGTSLLSGLDSTHTPRQQALILLRAMFSSQPEAPASLGKASSNGFTKSRQVLFSDTVGTKDADSRWAAAKAAAYKGPVTVNTNSNNKIQVYIVTSDEILEIFNTPE